MKFHRLKLIYFFLVISFIEIITYCKFSKYKHINLFSIVKLTNFFNMNIEKANVAKLYEWKLRFKIDKINIITSKTLILMR